MKLIRKIRQNELNLLEKLIDKAGLVLDINWKDDLLVEEMDDGGMGSLELLPNGYKKNRMFGSMVSELEFKDQDGTQVLVSLNLDEEGGLYELDFFKADSSPLISLPMELS